MSDKELIEQIRKLPVEARQEAIDFVEFLSQKYLLRTEKPNKIGEKSVLNSSFRGIWKDREDLQDSTKWVREQRRSRWAE